MAYFKNKNLYSQKNNSIITGITILKYLILIFGLINFTLCNTPLKKKSSESVVAKKAWLPDGSNFKVSKDIEIGKKWKNFQKLKNGKTVTTLFNGNKKFKEVALTFDIGNFAGGEFILDTLKKENVKATMFLANNHFSRIRNKKTGVRYDTLYFDKNFTTFKDLVKRMRAEGHMIGNHTWGHHHLEMQLNVSGKKKIKVDKKYFLNQLERVEKTVFNMTGKKIDPVWRAPFGEFTLEQISWAEQRGYTYFQWTVALDSIDYQDRESNPQMLARLQRRARNGGIYLFHLGNNLRRKHPQAYYILPALIKYLRKKGYSIVTLKQLVNDVQD